MKFTKGQPKIGGRQPGSQNKATRDIRAIARGLIEDPEYQKKLKARLHSGASPTLEVLLHYYAYGKPKTEIVSDKTVTVIVQRDTPDAPRVVNAQALSDSSMSDAYDHAG